MRIIAYAITLLAGIAAALLIVFTLSKVGILGPVCMTCILSRSVMIYPGSVESHNSYITIGGIAVPNVSNIHVHGHEIISQGVSKIPNQSPIIRIGPPRTHGPGSNGPTIRRVLCPDYAHVVKIVIGSRLSIDWPVDIRLRLGVEHVSRLAILDEHGHRLPYFAKLPTVWIRLPYLRKGKTILYACYSNGPMRKLGNIRNIVTRMPIPSKYLQYFKYMEITFRKKYTAPSGLRVISSWHCDDCCWTLKLPFNFPLYDKASSNIYVCSNGILSLAQAVSNYISTIGEFKYVEYGIALYWADLFPVYGYGSIYVGKYCDNLGCGLAIRYATRFYPGIGWLDATAVLYGNGIVRFMYGRIVPESTTDPIPVIGLSRGDDIHYTATTKIPSKGTVIIYIPILDMTRIVKIHLAKTR